MHTVPLKIKIGLKPDGSANYPPFNKIPASLRDGADWSKFIDRYSGWIYDKQSGHMSEDDESPRGFHFGIVLVPESFATAAVERFADLCEVLTDDEAADWYERRVTINDPEIIEDLHTLQIIAAKRSAGLPEDDGDRAALDINNPRPGRQRNERKTWNGLKRKLSLTVDDSAVANAKAAHARARANRG